MRHARLLGPRHSIYRQLRITIIDHPLRPLKHPTMLEYRTSSFSPSNVRYSPFHDSLLAVSASANYGLIGNGQLSILSLSVSGIHSTAQFTTRDALYDVAWSEAHENQLVTASGDGSLKLFDQTVPDFPIAEWREHAREVFSVDWSGVDKSKLCSGSWDGTVRVWDVGAGGGHASEAKLDVGSCVYSAKWSPHAPALLSAVSSDSQLRVWDLRTTGPPSASSVVPRQLQPVISIPIHAASSARGFKQPQQPQQSHPSYPPAEALTHDWNKYRDTVVATAGVDKLVRTFDLRAPGQGPLCMLSGHEYGVRKVAWSPHLSDVLLSASYDMTCRVWTDGFGGGGGGRQPGAGGVPRQLGSMGRHTEFVTGLDWCLFGAEGWCASCGWDERVLVWDVRAVMGS